MWVPDLRCAADALHRVPDTTTALHRSRRDAAVDHDSLPGHEARSIRAEIRDSAGNLVGLADAPQRRGGAAALQPLFVFPERAREIGLDQTRRDTIDAHAFRSPLAGKTSA